MFTVSSTKTSPVVKGFDEGNASSLRIIKNPSNKVWCVTVPSGVIVVRRKGFSMLCGNCAESQALRKGWPEIGQQPTAEEMEGKDLDFSEIKDVTAKAAVAPEQPAIAYYPQERFVANLEAWQQLMESGKKTAQQIIATASSKYILSEEQILAIRDLEPIQ